MMIFGDGYDQGHTAKELQYVDPKLTATTESIKADQYLSQFFSESDRQRKIYSPENKGASAQDIKSFREILKNIQLPESVGERLEAAKEFILHYIIHLAEEDA